MIIILITSGYLLDYVINDLFSFFLVVVLIGIQQPINAYFRPEPPTPPSPKRIRWALFHKYCG